MNRAKKQTTKNAANVFKPQHSIVPYEDVILGQLYAVTINPTDEHQHMRCSVTDNRINGCYLSLVGNLLLPCKETTAAWKLYPELSAKGRFHWHGYIKIFDVVDFYLNFLPGLLKKCTFVMKKLFTDSYLDSIDGSYDESNDTDAWESYCTKQESLHKYITSHTFCAAPYESNKWIETNDNINIDDAPSAPPEVETSPIHLRVKLRNLLNE